MELCDGAEINDRRTLFCTSSLHTARERKWAMDTMVPVPKMSVREWVMQEKAVTVLTRRLPPPSNNH